MDRCRREPTYEPHGRRLSKPQCTNVTSPLPGRWLLDGSIEKRVDFTECPLISSAYACRYLGTPHADEAARLRYSPDCRLEPFCAESFVRWLAGRKLVVTGDSHGRQALASLACKLYKARRVRDIRGPCNTLGNSSVHRCTAGGQYAQDRRLCGPHHCTFDAIGPVEALEQSGVAGGTDILLADGGGSLHMRELPRGYQDSSSSQMAHIYEELLPPLIADMRLTANDTLIVSDMAAHRTNDPAGLRAAAASLVAFLKRAHAGGTTPRVLWLDYQAPHFAHRSGEFAASAGADTCVASNAPVPAVPSTAAEGPCRPHGRGARGAGAGAVDVLQSAGVEVVHSFHATRLVHVGHSGARWVNYSRWKQPDCHHVCSPSGAEELRTSLIVNMLLHSQTRGVKASARRIPTSLHNVTQRSREEKTDSSKCQHQRTVHSRRECFAAAAGRSTA